MREGIDKKERKRTREDERGEEGRERSRKRKSERTFDVRGVFSKYIRKARVSCSVYKERVRERRQKESL